MGRQTDLSQTRPKATVVFEAHSGLEQNQVVWESDASGKRHELLSTESYPLCEVESDSLCEASELGPRGVAMLKLCIGGAAGIDVGAAHLV